MAAAQYDFFVEQGATFQKIITWKDADDNPINLTSFTARMQFRRAKRSDDVLYSANTENGMITLGGAAGTITIDIPAEETEAFGFRRAVYDLEVESAGGIVTRLIEGSVELSREVTRP